MSSRYARLTPDQQAGTVVLLERMVRRPMTFPQILARFRRKPAAEQRSRREIVRS